MSLLFMLLVKQIEPANSPERHTQEEFLVINSSQSQETPQEKKEQTRKTMEIENDSHISHLTLPSLCLGGLHECDHSVTLEISHDDKSNEDNLMIKRTTAFLEQHDDSELYNRLTNIYLTDDASSIQKNSNSDHTLIYKSFKRAFGTGTLKINEKKKRKSLNIDDNSGVESSYNVRDWCFMADKSNTSRENGKKRAGVTIAGGDFLNFIRSKRNQTQQQITPNQKMKYLRKYQCGQPLKANNTPKTVKYDVQKKVDHQKSNTRASGNQFKHLTFRNGKPFPLLYDKKAKTQQLYRSERDHKRSKLVNKRSERVFKLPSSRKYENGRPTSILKKFKPKTTVNVSKKVRWKDQITSSSYDEVYTMPNELQAYF